MSWQIELILILAGLVIFFFFLWRKAANHRDTLAFQKSSLSSKYGKMSEQFMPFLKDYPYDSQNFRFLGSPVDGVQFCEDKIVFVEFKTATSRLSDRQRQIAELIWNKKVSFEEHRLE